MSGQRTGWQGTVKVPTSPATESPNRQVDAVTCHIRVYWPHTATDADVLEAMDRAWRDAIQAVGERRRR